MKNVKLERKGDTLVITIDLSKSFGPSKTGKSTIVASSEGNMRVPGSDDAFVGVNVYKK